MTSPAGAPGIGELSCFTAAIACYLSAEHDDVTTHVARSVRLAIAPDAARLAFSHHRFSLSELPGGGHLAYAGAPAPAAREDLLTELARHGRVIVVGRAAALPWSPVYGASEDAHWFIVDDHQPGHWHVVDRFSALMPGGEHHPYAGWLSDGDLAAVLAPREDVDLVGRNRDRYAFGAAVPTPPPDQSWWIRRTARSAPVVESTRWLTGPAALELLAERLAAGIGEIAPYAPDIWAAARHRIFQLEWLAGRPGTTTTVIAEMTEIWRSLPVTMRFAVESELRGRSRVSPLRHTLQALIRAEASFSSSTGAPHAS